MELKLIDNKGDNTLENLISEKVTKHSKISIQTAAFSIFCFSRITKGNQAFKGVAFGSDEIFL